MAINPTCDKCGIELSEFGAILLGPPNKLNLAKKLHLCVGCYKKILKLLKQSKL